MASNSKKNPQELPVVTKLPLPISEESLLVDLPDGQKLVIGKMSNGSVIEVATWRGTGRPDSRTTRLMLGMSNTASDGEVSDSEGKTDAPAVNSQAATALTYLQSIAAKLRSLTPKKGTSVKLPKKITFEKADSEAATPIDIETQKWLDEILDKQKKSEISKANRAAKAAPAKKSVAKKAVTKKATQAKKGKARP